MKEKTSMNQKIIKVILGAPDEKTDALVFEFDEKSMDVNLNEEDCQASLKSIFVYLLQEVINADIQLFFSTEEGYNRQFYIEACEEYIKDLNRELNSIKEKLRNELEG